MSQKNRHGDPNTRVVLTIALALFAAAGVTGATLGVLAGAL